ncbi:MAG: adenosine deaminase [Acidimicrobiia bacterium]|nr:adenosine deaminase [Acidimicrobiia bacterium]
MSREIAALPKVELHLHLEGSLRPVTMFALAGRHAIDLDVASAEELTARYRFESFDDFLRLFIQGLDVLVDGEDFASATVALAAELAGQNVRYAEVTTTPFNHHRRGIAMGDYVSGLNEGRRRAGQEHGVELGWVCDIPRELEDPDLGFTVDLITGPDAPEGVVALGLGGPEVGFPPEQFAGSFARARAAGLGSVPHAGETVGAESVWGAVRALGADRIGHGVRSVEDPGLVAYLADNAVPLEVSMTSNVLLRVAPSLEEHPIRALLDAGVPVTINTDDPAYFSTDLTRELQLAHDVHGVSLEQLREVQRTAINASFATDAVKRSVLDELG